MKIPKYARTRKNLGARTDSGIVPSKKSTKRSSSKRKKGTSNGSGSSRTVGLDDGTRPGKTPPASVPEAPKDSESIPSTNPEASTNSSNPPPKKLTKGSIKSKESKKKSAIHPAANKQIAVVPLGRTDLEEIGEAELLAPTGPAVKNQKDLDMLREAKRLWLEYEYAAEEELNPNAKCFNYGAYNARSNKIIVAAPKENMQKSKRPTSFTITTAHGEPVCEVSFSTGTFCKQNIKIQVRMRDENIGTVKQVSNMLLVFELSGHEIMRFIGVPKIGMCNKRGPDAFNCEVYLSEKSFHHSVGVFGKNSGKKENVMLGVASGFYFIAAKGTQDEFDEFHKIFILSTMVSLMTYFSQ